MSIVMIHSAMLHAASLSRPRRDRSYLLVCAALATAGWLTACQHQATAPPPSEASAQGLATATARSEPRRPATPAAEADPAQPRVVTGERPFQATPMPGEPRDEQASSDAAGSSTQSDWPGGDAGEHATAGNGGSSSGQASSSGRGDVPEGDRDRLSLEEIRPILRKSNRLASGCHALTQGGDPSATGTVTVELTVSPDGSVEDVGVDVGDLGSELADCLALSFEKLEFPESTAETRVSKRVTFH